MGGMTPNHLYQKYYGKPADAHDENNIGGFIRYEHGLGDEDGFVFASAYCGCHGTLFSHE